MPRPLTLTRQPQAGKWTVASCGSKVAIQVCSSFEPCHQNPFGTQSYTCGRMRIAHNSLLVMTDVGGGNTKDTTEYSNEPTNFALSHIPLRWMIQEIVNSNCGIRFVDDDRLVGLLQRWHIPVHETKSPLPPKAPKDEQPYDNRDAKAKIIDELKPTFAGFFRWIGWCFMELLPTYYEWQEKRIKDGEEQWVWCWQFRQVTHPLIHILAIVLIEICDGARAQLEFGPGTSAPRGGRDTRKRQVLHERGL